MTMTAIKRMEYTSCNQRLIKKHNKLSFNFLETQRHHELNDVFFSDDSALLRLCIGFCFSWENKIKLLVFDRP